MRHHFTTLSGRQRQAAAAPLHSHLLFARPDTLPWGVVRFLTLGLSAAGVALMLISLHPFASASIVSDTGVNEGSVVNQVGFLAAGLVFALAMLSLASRAALASIVTPGVMLLGVVLAYNIAIAPDPNANLRAVVLTLIGMFIAFSVVVLSRSEKDFQSALIMATMATLALSYGGLILAPDLAKHGYDAFEPQHAGLWRGHFIHKNVAGPVMCVIAIFGVYLMRTGHRMAGLVIFAAGALFVLETGSKTTTGFFPVSILIVLMASVFGRSSAAIAALVVTLALVAILTLGSIYSPIISNLVESLLGDPTYTGRTTLWEFSLSKIPEHPLLGFGLYNFWSSETVYGLDKPFEADWDYRFIVHGHNNYLDIILNLGLLGGLALIWFLFIAPIINYAKARRIPGNARLADMFFMIIVFMSLLSFIESFLLARDDPIWLMHVFAVFGLHVLARFDIGSGAYRRSVAL